MKFSKEINERAWRIKRKGYSWREAIKLAMESEKVKKVMRTRIVKLTFQKSDGSITERLATLCKLMVGDFEIKGAGRKVTSEKVTFWSMDDKGFRSFLPQNLLAWEPFGERVTYVLKPELFFENLKAA